MTINTIALDHKISNTGLHKLKKEISSWKNLLYLRMEENVLLKNRLANILRNNYDKNCLEEIEEFQNQFIHEDGITKALRQEISDLDSFIFKRFEDERQKALFENKVKKMRADMTLSEQRFQLLVSSFDDFQHKICG